MVLVAMAPGKGRLAWARGAGAGGGCDNRLSTAWPGVPSQEPTEVSVGLTLPRSSDLTSRGAPLGSSAAGVHVWAPSVSSWGDQHCFSCTRSRLMLTFSGFSFQHLRLTPYREEAGPRPPHGCRRDGF